MCLLVLQASLNFLCALQSSRFPFITCLSTLGGWTYPVSATGATVLKPAGHEVLDSPFLPTSDLPQQIEPGALCSKLSCFLPTSLCPASIAVIQVSLSFHLEGSKVLQMGLSAPLVVSSSPFFTQQQRSGIPQAVWEHVGPLPQTFQQFPVTKNKIYTPYGLCGLSCLFLLLFSFSSCLSLSGD